MTEFYEETNWQAIRDNMVETQLAHRGIGDQRVLSALREVPRECFVDESVKERAYDDCPLPIGFGQTISQPYTVAFMLQAMQFQGNEKILEIGTGSGYQAAALSLLVREVHTIERIADLGNQSASMLARLGYSNVHVHIGDGTLGLPEQAPFDAIIVTASSQELPAPYVNQIAEGGKIIIPIGDHPNNQSMLCFTRKGDQLLCEDLGGFRFVPLIGEYGWDEPGS